MAEKSIKLKLDVDSRAGDASIKRTSTQMKALGTTAATSGAAVGTGAKAGAGGMLLMGAATAKAVTIITKLNRTQAMGLPIMGEHIDKAIKLEEAELAYCKAMHKGTAVSEKRLKNLNKLGKEYVRYTKDVVKNTKVTEKNTKAAKKNTKALKNMKTHAGAQKKALLLVGVGLTAAVVIGAKFERQMATVGGVMRATKWEMEALTKAARDMGAGSEWGANKAAEALKFMGMAGYTSAQAIEALPGILNLATAAGLDLGSVSDIVTDSLTAMGMGVEELERFNDVLIGTTTRSNTNILMLGESLKYVAPVASQMGYDIEQLSAMLGTLANAGIKASDAGTDLRQAMIKNVKVAKKFGKAENDLIGTLEAAADAGWGVTEVTENYGLIAAKSVLVLMKQIEGFKKLEGELRNVEGETKKLADVKLDTLIGDFNLLQSAAKELGQHIYDFVETPLRFATKAAGEAITAMNKFFETKPEEERADIYLEMGFTSTQIKSILELEDKKLIALKNLEYAEKNNLQTSVEANEKRIQGYNEEIAKLVQLYILKKQEPVIDYEAEFTALNAWIDKDLAARAETAAQAQANADKIKEYTNSALQNTILAIEKERKEYLELAKTKSEINAINKKADDDITAARADTASRRLQIDIDTEKVRIQRLYEGYEEQKQLYQIDLQNFKGTADERLAYEKYIDEQILLLNQDLVEDVSEGLQKLAEKGELSEGILAAVEPIKEFFDEDYDINVDIDLTGMSEEQLKALLYLLETIGKTKIDTKGLESYAEKVEKLGKKAWEDVGKAAKSSIKDGIGGAIKNLSAIMEGESEAIKAGFTSLVDNLIDIWADYVVEMTVLYLAEEAKRVAATTATTAATTATTAATGAAGGILGGLGGGWQMAAAGLALGVISHFLQDDDDEEEEERRKREAWEKEKIAAYQALEKTLKQNTKALDAQLEATHSWSDAMAAALQTYKDAIDEIAALPGAYEEEVDEDTLSKYELSNIALVNYFKELALIVRDVNESLTDFEHSIASMTMTAYESKMADVEKYYEDMGLAIEDTIKRQRELEGSISSYRSAEAYYRRVQTGEETAENWWATYRVFREEGGGGGLNPFRGYMVWLGEQATSAAESAKELEALQVDYDDLLENWEGSYEESIAAIKKYYADQREAVFEDIDDYVRKITGSMSDMEEALYSIDKKFKAWTETIKDLGGTTSEINEIMEQALIALKAVAEEAIFAPFESIREDLALLEAEMEGTSAVSYYLDKFLTSMSDNNWIAASEYLQNWYDAQKDSTDLWSKVIDKTDKLVEDIQKVIDSIKYSKLNIALPTVKAEMAVLDYAELKAAALVGGAEEIKEFIGFASKYLKISQDTLKSSEAYQEVYEDVMADLISFQEKIETGDYDQKIYTELSNMNETLNENLLSVGTSLEEHLEALRISFERGFKASEYTSFAGGGISTGPSSGYLAELHGREAVIPLDSGSIPISIQDNTQDRPMNINVYIGNEQLDTHIVQQADMLRVKANRRANISTQRLF